MSRTRAGALLVALLGCGSAVPQDGPGASGPDNRPADRNAPGPQGPAAKAPQLERRAPTVPQPAPSSSTGKLPAPFTAAQIREATVPGRLYRFRVESHKRPSAEIAIEFIKVSEEGATFETVIRSDRGKELTRKKSTETWQGLEGHADFPAATSSVTAMTIEVPAGSFIGRLYTNDDAKSGLITRMYFANDLPGAALKVEVEDKSTSRVMRRITLLEYRAGTNATSPR